MPRRCWRPVAAPVLAALALGMVADCSTVTSAKPAGGGTQIAATSAPLAGCGTTRTAAGVPVEIEITHGQVACSAALAVERDYARALASGKVPGNGGGAPVKVRGWVCRGFATPQVLATGHTSACTKGAGQILAVLKMPASPTPSS
jgi:hypothetical protein